ncbi:IscS subfamily cysteine desulfurase [Echinicola sediminis]
MMDRLPIYLDYCSTTPCAPEVVEAMLPFFGENFGNPSSKDHFFGWTARDAVDEARGEIAQLICAKPHQLLFTSGATESMNLVLKSLTDAQRGKRNHIITCATEHSAVLNTCRFLEQGGMDLSYLPVDAKGEIILKQLEELISDKTLAIIIMGANNETGTIHPIREIGKIAQDRSILFICDGTQAVGKISIDINRWNVDYMAFSAHKMYGPKGIGGLYVRDTKGNFIKPLIHGGGQEKDLRSGTLNVPAIVGWAKAASLCKRDLAQEASRLELLREDFEAKLKEGIPGIRINGGEKRLPNISNITFPEGNAEELLLALSPKLAMSRGSACNGINPKPSHVLRAMGLSEEEALRSVRISMGRYTTSEMMDYTVRELINYAQHNFKNLERIG